MQPSSASSRPDRHTRPSKFTERLSIATAASTDLGLPSAPKPNHSTRHGKVGGVGGKSQSLAPTLQSPDALDEKQLEATAPSAPKVGRPGEARTAKSVPQHAAAFDGEVNGSNGERPRIERRRTTAQTRYMDMLLELDSIPRLHNILASFSTWVLLAGYLVFPATFSSLQHNQRLSQDFDSGVEAKVLEEVRNAPLLYIAAAACIVGVAGCAWLWSRHRRNYVWLLNRVFLPTFMNSVAGLISTLVNVYTAQAGQYSVTAKVTAAVTGACTVVAAGLFLLYNNLALARVKKHHRRETEGYKREVERREAAKREKVRVDRQRSGSRFGFFAALLRRVNKPAMEPESVV